jgi:hypothetical protein
MLGVLPSTPSTVLLPSRVVRAVAASAAVAIVLLSFSAIAVAQESKTVALAKQLAAALDAGKLDSVAEPNPTNPGTFVAALYFAGSQLLVVSAKYSVPQLLNDKLAKKDYRDVYIDLNSASVPETKIFIEDLGADGLKAKREDNQPFDSYESGGKRTSFDNDWKRQKLTEQEYMKIYSTAEEDYAQMLTALLAQVKRTS